MTDQNKKELQHFTYCNSLVFKWFNADLHGFDEDFKYSAHRLPSL